MLTHALKVARQSGRSDVPNRNAEAAIIEARAI